MQIVETSAEGLKRQLKVTLPAGDLTARRDKRLDEVKDRVQIKGFRKGKVPPAHIKKIYGRSIMAEVLQEAVDETTKAALNERKERPAGQPQIVMPEDQAEIERVIAGEADLAFSMSYEILPQITLADFSTFEIERLVADVPESEVAAAIERIAERNQSYETVEGRAVETGDRITMDFVGRIDGETFEGGSAEDAQIVIGEGRLIPGFEDGLMGATAGETRAITPTFPDDYPAAHLAGKTASFDVTVKDVAKPVKPAIDDAFAATLGLESLDKLREVVKAEFLREQAAVSRLKMKRQVLDRLDAAHTFDAPPSLVDSEFEGIWRQVMDAQKQSGKTFEDEGKTEDGAREEYRTIAARRVRLGLVIAEVGERSKVEVTQEELRRALIEETRRYPGQERMVYEFYEKNPGALGQLRAPIFEDKVIDIIIGGAKVTDRTVDREDLLKPIEEEAA